MSCLYFFAGDSFVHRLDPRLRLITALVFSFAITLSTRWPVLLCGAVSGTLLAFAARLDSRRLARRLAHVNLFMLFLWIVLPWRTPGPELIIFDFFVISVSGLSKAAEITLKGNAVVLVFTALAATIPPHQFGCALKKLGFPDKFVYLVSLVVRYTDWIHDEYVRLRSSMKARAFHPRFSFHTLRILGYLVGMLILRCVERSERVLAAMKCRGFDGRFRTLSFFRFRTVDAIFGFVALSCLCAWIGLEFFW